MTDGWLITQAKLEAMAEAIDAHDTPTELTSWAEVRGVSSDEEFAEFRRSQADAMWAALETLGLPFVRTPDGG